MRCILQRVAEASVCVDGKTVSAIERGYMLLLGILKGDGKQQAEWIAEKVINLRLFEGDDGKSHEKTILDVGGDILVVSQFTLAGDVSKGRRPDYVHAASAEEAKPLYEYFVECLRCKGVRVETGIFRAMMQVQLVNDGPVTLVIER
jgi:D-aminoacyl-tRNA deacylase